MVHTTQTVNASSCLGRTCLKWGPDGELTSVDLRLVLERLAEVDQSLTALRQESHDAQGCPSSG
jgi:hypothetical protein